MKRFVAAALASFWVALMAGNVARAQSTDDFVAAFSGEWFAFDSGFGSGDQPCQIELRKDKLGERFKAMQKNCQAPLASVAAWGILNNQLGLFDGQGNPVAQLGGNQLRVTGQTQGGNQGVIFERAQGDGANVQLSNAIQHYGCYFEGFSNKCAGKADLAKPEIASESGVANVQVLVNLNVRSQPRRNAATIGTITQNTCVKVKQCLRASDGIWCRAQFGDKTGWFGKSALRQGKWPVITFRNTCSGES